MLSIVVCVKAVPDPQEADKIRIDPVTKNLARHDIPLVINPLDRNALEQALSCIQILASLSNIANESVGFNECVRQANFNRDSFRATHLVSCSNYQVCGMAAHLKAEIFWRHPG